jgi:hypothetical protein
LIADKVDVAAVDSVAVEASLAQYKEKLIVRD